MRNYSSDIPRNNWVDSMPSATRPYIRLARFDRPIGTWLVLFPGWWSLLFAGFDPLDEPGRHIYIFWLFLLFGLGAIVMRGAGCILNDVFDCLYKVCCRLELGCDNQNVLVSMKQHKPNTISSRYR